MEKKNNRQAKNQISKSTEFKVIRDKIFISLKAGNNEFANLVDNEIFFQQLKHYGN